MNTLNVAGSIPKIVNNDENIVYLGNLKHYFRSVFNHAVNLNNYYHNFRHLCHVLYLCYKACEYYGDQLTPRQCRNLLIAALFHDFDHTGKPGPDIVNVAKAIAGIATFILPEDQEFLAEIIMIIKATEYPYKEGSAEGLSLSGKIIRDADQSQAFSIAWLQQVVLGLSKEWSTPEKEIKPMDVLKMQKPFLSNLAFLTEWAKEEFPQSVISAKVQESLELLQILNEE